ncbi:MAG: flagellar biosynthesis protein FlhB [Candidatus Marinimicrobia bacterium]|nr:flagellar biosynthesis protein FlhB [Candidatus Neomarinimicrobiota bacterium]
MAEQQAAQDKTEQATPKRLEEAKDKGNVAKSQDLNSVVLLFAGIFGLTYSANEIITVFMNFTMNVYNNAVEMDITKDTVSFYSAEFMKTYAGILGPIMLVLFFAALAVNYVQVGVMVAKKALVPKFEKINPAKGFKRMFSTRSLVELAKGVLKISLVAYVGVSVIRSYIDEFWLLAFDTVPGTLSFLGEVLYSMTVKIGLLLIIIGVADFAYQKYDHAKNLKMTKQEVKEESKQYEGNAEVKGKIKQAQLAASRARMLTVVPDATVVVTNPTFIAIAIKYDPKSKADAPKVLAKGKRKLAQKIKEIARANSIPVIENKALARGLYDYAQPGSEIPVFFYEAIAEILAEVYKMNKNKVPRAVA